MTMMMMMMMMMTTIIIIIIIIIAPLGHVHQGRLERCASGRTDFGLL
jgi:uncharacterized membrane protein